MVMEVNFGNTLPSQFQIGEEVVVRGTVTEINFTESKVSYVVKLADGDTVFFEGINLDPRRPDFLSDAPAGRDTQIVEEADKILNESRRQQ